MQTNCLLTERSLPIFEQLGIPLDSMLKRAAILYDKIYYYCPEYRGISDLPGNMRYNLASWGAPLLAESNFLNEIFIATKDFMSDFFHHYLLKINNLKKIDPTPETTGKLISLIKRYKYKDYQSPAELEEIDLASPTSMMEFLRNTLSVEAHITAYLTHYRPDINFLFTPLHRDYFEILWNENPPARDDIFHKIIKGQLFDFSTLSWENILELRRSKFAESFRKKFFNWINSEFRKEQTKETIDEINNYIFQTKFDFINAHRSNIPKKIFSALISNIPLPFPNPYSIFDSAKSLRNDITREKDFGWLMFLEEINFLQKKNLPG